MNGRFIALAVLALTTSAGATCDHPYLPSAVNTSWTYSSSTAGGGYTSRVVSNNGLAYVLENAYKNVRIQSEITCEADGSLIQKEYPSISGANTITQTLSSSGVAFPAANQWVIGGKWTQSFKIKLTIGPGNPGTVQFWTMTSNYTILSSENVAVPAGKFTALKVKRTTSLELVMVTQGDSSPMKSTETSTIWYARGVGVVKSMSGKVTSMLTDFVKV